MLGVIEWNWWIRFFFFPLTWLGYSHDNKVTIGFTNGIENQGAMDFEYGSGNVLKHLSPLEYARGMLKQDILRFFGTY